MMPMLAVATIPAIRASRKPNERRGASAGILICEARAARIALSAAGSARCVPLVSTRSPTLSFGVISNASPPQARSNSPREMKNTTPS
jgi:hypothetical protein